MKITSLRLHNFRPYYGDVSLDLSPAHGNPLVLIEGENMTGKTTLFMSIFWCLYGIAKDRTDKEIHVFSPDPDEDDWLINKKALEQGDYETSVAMNFEHDGETWELTRVAKCDGDPFHGEQFETIPYLKVGQDPIDTALIDNRINDVIHHDAAQFFLFDGELLAQYESWLADPDRAPVQVQSAIERTVGIAALRFAEPLEKVRKDFEKERLAAARKLGRNQEDTNRLEVLHKTIKGLRDEADKFQDEIKRMEGESKKIEDQHESLAAWNSAIKEIGAHESNITEEQNKETQANIDIRELVKTRYWMALGSTALTLAEDTSERIRQTIETGPHLVQTSLEDGVCAICDQDLGDEAHQHLEDKIDNSQEPLADIEDLRRAFERLGWAHRFYAADALGHLKTLEDAALTARLETRKASAEVSKLRNLHQTKGNYADQMNRLKTLTEDITRAKTDVDTNAGEIETAEAEANRLSDKILKAGTTNPAIDKRHEAATLAQQAFGVALGTFTVRARQAIAQGATDAFRELLVDVSGYDAIEISDDYRVHPIDKKGERQPAPSAGGQQLLTLSLLAGLNSSAAQEAPIVMDTPLGRIDNPNRKRIIEWVTRLTKERGQQAILMVHSGEVTGKELKSWGITPGRTYTITESDLYEHHITEKK